MIRPATLADAAAIAAIYNPYITDTVITFEEEAVSVEEMEGRIRKVSATFPWIVWEEEGQVLGYAYASSWRSRRAYRFAAETTVYVDLAHQRKGIGEKLYRELVVAMREFGFHSALGCLALPNDPSVALHEKLGFTKVAHMKEAGRKFEQWIDVGFWEIILA
ncbi:MAG: N-acetyltransferase family protein [Holophagaceae bacterium]|nr:N-acetyltransferase family protein [Holophagaceae bacterium]